MTTLNHPIKQRIKLLIFFTLYFLSIPFSTIAQISNGSLEGIVKSIQSEPLFPASIAIKGTSYGSTTNKDGSFSITVPTGTYVLSISFTGYRTHEQEVVVRANQSTQLGSLVLQISNEMLGEVTASAMINKFSKKESNYVAKMPLDNLENAQVYTVVPKELFTEQIATNFRSALMSSPGVTNVTLGLGSGGTGLAMHLRGFSGANGAGAIRNGMSTNFVSLSDPANLESLEIIKGPSSTLFGTTLISYGGLVNRVTKKPLQRKLSEVSFSSGSFGLGRIALDFNSPLNKEETFLFRINTAIQREKSFQDYGQNKTTMVAPSFSYKVNDRLTFDVDLEYFESNRTTTYLRIDATTPIESLDDLNWDFDKSYTTNSLLSSSKVFNGLAKATYKISDSWTSQTALSHSNTDNNANYIFLLMSDPSSITRRIMNIPSIFNTVQLQQNFIGDFKIGSLKNKLLVGLDYTQLETTDTRTAVVYDNISLDDEAILNVDAYQQMLSETNPYIRNKRSTKTYSAYASDVINITDQLIAMASLRIDHYENLIDNYEQTSLSPKFGVIYKVINDKVSLFGNFLDGFKNVSPQTTLESPNETVNFDPEHATQLEGGIKFELLNGKLNGSLSYYNIQVKNKVRSLSDDQGFSYSVQDGTQESKGFEVDLIANPIQGMNVIFGYGYNDSEFTKAAENINGNKPYAVPEHVGNFWLSYRLVHGKYKGLGLGFGGNFASDHFLNDENTITVPGYHKFDATVFYEQPKFRVGLKLNNINDEKYWMSDYDAEPQMPRSFIGNLTIKF